MKNIYDIDLSNDDVYQEKVWGNSAEIARLSGRDVGDFGDRVIGEVFLASTHRDGKSIFSSGQDFDDVIQESRDIFGDAVTPKKSFPLLLKILSAQEELSLQTHYKNKIEAWVTLSEGEILYGLTKFGEEAVSTPEGRESLSEILQNENDKVILAQYFNLISFVPGQAFIVHAGMAHALLRGTVFEPQKNSNLTLRGGDWGRNLPDRPLDKKDFFDSLYPHATPNEPIEKMYKMKEDGVHHACVFATQDFALDEIVVDGGSRTIETFDDRFFIAMVMDGEITLSSKEDQEVCSQGRIFVMGANPQQWTFSGHGTVFLTYVPNIIKGIIEPLQEYGYSYEEITRIGGPVIKENDIYITMRENGLL